MGMAASQARFLSLTARKTNVEWEGQQVNQQRTALANESANLYNELNRLEVPTPPSVKDYTKTVYTFTTTELDNNTEDKGSSDYRITNIYANAGGNYATVEHSVPYWQSAIEKLYAGSVYRDDQGNPVVDLGPNIDTSNVKEYTYEPTGLEFVIDIPDVNEEFTIPNFGTDKFQLAEGGGKLQWKGTDGSEVLASYDIIKLSNGKFKVTIKETTKENDENYNKLVNNSKTAYVEFAGRNYTVQRSDYVSEESEGTGNYIIIGDSADYVTQNGGQVGRYTNGGGVSTFDATNFDEDFYNYTTDNKKYYQPVLSYNIKQDDSTSTYYISAACWNSGYASGSYYLKEMSRTVSKDYPCEYTKNENGRIDKITLYDDFGDKVTTSLGITSEEDESAYNQAMLDYTYSKDKYEKAVKDINAKTEKIQQQDRTLELRLKQLDTEQNALKTEMDAVSKVIENNIESTFKTFA